MELTGKRFGRLVVTGTSTKRKGYVICRCDCGNVKEIRKTSLTKSTKPTRSCGCLHSEIVSALNAEAFMKCEKEKKYLANNRYYNTHYGIIKKGEPFRNNTTGRRGVSWNKEKHTYEAYLQVHGKRKFLGYYDDLEEATKARQRGEEEYFEPLIELIKNERED